MSTARNRGELERGVGPVAAGVGLGHSGNTPGHPEPTRRGGSRRRCAAAQLPAVPAGATHWQLSIDGAVKPLIPVSTTTYWITGLANGTGYSLGLAAVTVGSTPSSTVTAQRPCYFWSSCVLPALGTSSVRVTGETATFTLWFNSPATIGQLGADSARNRHDAAALYPHDGGGVASWALRACRRLLGRRAQHVHDAVGDRDVHGRGWPRDAGGVGGGARDGALRPNLLLPYRPGRRTAASVDGAVKAPVPVSTTTLWITGLANGTRSRVGPGCG